MSTPTTSSLPCRLLQLCRPCRLLQLCQFHVDSCNFVAPMATPTTLSPPSTPTTLSTSRQTPTTWQSHADKFVNSSLKFRKFEIPCRLNVVALLATPTTLSPPVDSHNFVDRVNSYNLASYADKFVNSNPKFERFKEDTNLDCRFTARYQPSTFDMSSATLVYEWTPCISDWCIALQQYALPDSADLPSVRAFASAYAYDVDSCSQLRRRLPQRQPSSQRSSSAGAHGLPLPPGRTLHRFRQRYPCSADDPGGGIITPRPAAPPPAPATTPTAAPAPPRMARHRPLRAPPVLLSVAHPRSPTSSTVAEPGPTPGRPPYPFWPPRPRRPGSPTPADEDPASCPLSASAGAAIPGSAAPTPYGGGMAHA